MRFVFEFSDDGVVVKTEIGPCGLVHITESCNTDFPVSIVVTAEGLADIARAVAQHLEEES